MQGPKKPNGSDRNRRSKHTILAQHRRDVYSAFASEQFNFHCKTCRRVTVGAKRWINQSGAEVLCLSIK